MSEERRKRERSSEEKGFVPPKPPVEPKPDNPPDGQGDNGSGGTGDQSRPEPASEEQNPPESGRE
jgi:hypothetical protein